MADETTIDPERVEAIAKNAASLAELQARQDELDARGYVGTVPDATPNDAYGLTTGPAAPALVPDDRTQTAQHGAPLLVDPKPAPEADTEATTDDTPASSPPDPVADPADVVMTDTEEGTVLPVDPEPAPEG